MAEVRRVRVDEVVSLREVRLAALESDPDAFSAAFEDEAALSDESWRDRVDRASSGGDAATFLSHADGSTPTGLVTMLRCNQLPASAEMVSMWTDPKNRSTGTGTALVEAAIAWAKNAGYESVQLWVMSDNHAARQFYERRGFGQIDPGDVDDADPCRDQIRMERRL